jgi:S1-C subfamily serine protease
MRMPQSVFGLLAILAANLILCSSLPGTEPMVKKLDTSFPAKDLEAIGSGSGIIIGPRLILTNQHVAMNGRGPAAGFQVLIGPDYKTKIAARAAWVCENYDLAILETSADLPSSIKLLLLDDLPPLGTKVTACGFPLGDEFGISLTISGGQVTRHPVETDDAKDDSGETADIKRSLWHDATTAGGRSGGPLFPSKSVLVGLQYGSIVRAKGQGIAVPPAVIASALKKVKAGNRVKCTRPSKCGSRDGYFTASIVTPGCQVDLAGKSSSQARFATTC